MLPATNAQHIQSHTHVSCMLVAPLVQHPRLTPRQSKQPRLARLSPSMPVHAHRIDPGTPDFFLRCQFKHIRLVQARQTAQGMPDCLLAHQFNHIRLAQTCQTGPRHARLTPGTSIQAHQAGPSTPDSPNACHIASWHASSSISNWLRHARLAPDSRGQGHPQLSIPDWIGMSMKRLLRP